MGQDMLIINMFKDLVDQGLMPIRINTHILAKDEPSMGRRTDPTSDKIKMYKNKLNLAGVKFFMDGALGS